MCGILIIAILAILMASSSYAFTDSLWIVGREGTPGALVSVQVWLQYEGSGGGDSIGDFDIPLTFDASVCTVEAITIGQDFVEKHLIDQSQIDNRGFQGPPPLPKVGVSAWQSWSPIGSGFVERGTHLAAILDVRILDTAVPSESTCFDTLMEAFSPTIFLGFRDMAGTLTYVPSFCTDWIRVIPCACGDCNGDGRVTVADAIYTSTYIYKCGHVPACEADVNEDSRITIADAIYTLTYIYKGGPEPCD